MREPVNIMRTPPNDHSPGAEKVKGACTQNGSHNGARLGPAWIFALFGQRNDGVKAVHGENRKNYSKRQPANAGRLRREIRIDVNAAGARMNQPEGGKSNND